MSDMVANMKAPRGIQEFIRAAEDLKQEERSKISGRIRILTKVKAIFSDITTPMEDYLSPGQLSILDLSGMDQALANYFSHRVLNTIYENKAESASSLPPLFHRMECLLSVRMLPYRFSPLHRF